MKINDETKANVIIFLFCFLFFGGIWFWGLHTLDILGIDMLLLGFPFILMWSSVMYAMNNKWNEESN
jgi:hypothetical protein